MDRDSLYDLKQRIGAGKLGAPALIACAIVAAVVAVYAGIYIYGAVTANSFSLESQSASDVSAATSNADASQSSPAEHTSESADSEPIVHILVDVEGAVNSPGIVSVPEGARINDAIAAADGLTEDAASGAVNLAQKMHDGEQVIVPTFEQASSSYSEVANSGGADATSSGNAQTPAKVNINTADESALQTVSGIGPSTAKKIVADRTKNGPFSSVDDLTRVSGIGEKKLEAFRDQLCV